MANNTGSKTVGSHTYHGGIGKPDGFGHGHINHGTGYNRPAIGGASVKNALGHTAVMSTYGKSNVSIGKSK